MFLIAGPGLATDSSPTDRAKGVFESLASLSKAFDPSAADLYSDEAKVVSVRKYPSGLPDKKLELTGVQYKELLRKSMPMAKARGDVSTYSDCTYKEEGENVRVACTRYSELKEYSAPHSVLIGPREDGEWLILEELSQTRP